MIVDEWLEKWGDWELPKKYCSLGKEELDVEEITQ